MYCVRCGRQLQDDANFCHNCGAKTYQPDPVELLWPSDTQKSVPALETPIVQTPAESGVSLAAMVCGILAICLFWIVLPGIVLGLVALIFGIRSMAVYPDVKKGQAAAAIILGITAIALSALIISQLWGNPNIFLNFSNSGLSHL